MYRSILITFAVLGLTACGPSAEPASVDAEPLLMTRAETLISDTDSEVAEPIIESAPEIALLSEEEPEATVDPQPTAIFRLRRGETLAHFARWSGIPVEDIAESSALDLDGAYAVGTEVVLPVGEEGRALVQTRRDTHHRVRAENYLASRGASGTEFYAVKTGDSAWTIARDRHGMPVWLLESLNPSADLDRLRPGASLLVPVFNDIVAEAPAPDEVEATVETHRIDAREADVPATLDIPSRDFYVAD